MGTVEGNLAETIAGLYQAFVLGAGLLALVYTSLRWKRWRATRRAPGAWQLSGVDFSLFIVAIVLLALFSGVIGNALASFLSGTPEDEIPPLGIVAALSSLIMQTGFILLFWQWRELHRSETEGPIDSQPLGLAAILRFALILIFASYPIVLLVSAGWQYGLEFLRDLGLPIAIELQGAIELFQETEQVWVLVVLVVTAVILAPIGEELVFRAGLYRFLLGRLGKSSAMLVSAVLFGLVHANLFSFAPLAILGVLLCLAYELTGNLKVPILMHMIFNANTVALVLLVPEVLTQP